MPLIFCAQLPKGKDNILQEWLYDGKANIEIFWGYLWTDFESSLTTERKKKKKKQIILKELSDLLTKGFWGRNNQVQSTRMASN